jgi:hypothetical protein
MWLKENCFFDSNLVVQPLTQQNFARCATIGAGIVLSLSSLDGNVRVYDLRMGELRTDFLGRKCTSVSVSNCRMWSHILSERVS